MQYKVQNVTMQIDTTPGEFAGDCIVYIPKGNERFFEEWCGVERNENYEERSYEHVYEHPYGLVYYNEGVGKYHSSDPDILITYLSWLFSEPGEQTIEVEYQNPFWAIHDAEHAQNDEAGCTIYVDEYVELQRLRDAFDLMKAAGFEATYELVEDVAKAYNERFGKNESFEEYFEYEDYE